MKKRFLIIILSLIFFISFITLILIFNYLDPYESKAIALISMTIAFLFSVTSFSTLCLYYFKRIYFRGEVSMNHLMTSFRQGVFVAIFFLGAFMFATIGAPVFISSFLLAAILGFGELFIKNLQI